MKAASRFALVVFWILCGALPASAQTNLPAFPGAEGFGAHASGGRYGDVYHVINLSGSASTPGSFAYGLANAPATGRTIIFNVSGYIPVSGNLYIDRSKITIAGQTAPGDGVGIKGGTLWVRTGDTIIRHFRLRNGVSADCFDITSAATNTVIDHCDTLFSKDENFSSFQDPPENMTFQWSFNAWGLYPHSAGGLWYVNHATSHHSLWAHNHTRDPKALPSGLLDWVNNITFDYGIGFILADSTQTANYKANVENNYFVCPPGNTRPYALSRAGSDSNGVPNFSLYLTNNLWDTDGDYILDGYDHGWSMVSVNPTNINKMTNAFARTAGIPVTQDSALVAYKKIVSQGGPLRLDVNHPNGLRDEVATELILSLVSQRMDRFSSVTNTGASNGGYGTLSSTPAPPDTDRDGMPDYWETTLGSNPAVDDHTNQVSVGAFIPNNPVGYTLLEEYLHFKATPHAVLGRSLADNLTSQDVDLRAYTIGFTNKAPVTYTIANVSTGAVTLIGGNLARFAPPTNYFGRASFDFTVTDGDGSAWTQKFLLLVTTNATPRDLIWKGDGMTNSWNTNALNFLKGTNAVSFRDGDHATFDDSGSASPYLKLTGALAPLSLTVSAAKDYVFGSSGTLVGAMALQKSGAGTLTVSNANTFTGGTLIDGGTLIIAPGGRLGSGMITLAGGTLTSTYGSTTELVLADDVVVPAGETGTVNLSPRMTIIGASGDGTLNVKVTGSNFNYDRFNGAFANFTGTLNITGSVSTALLTLNYNGGSFDGNLSGAMVNLDSVTVQGQHNSFGNTLTLGALSGTASATLGGSGYAGNQTISVGSLGLDTTFAGGIEDGVAVTTLTKTGVGTLTLTGTTGHSGTTTVSAGTLAVGGVFNASPVNVAANGTLAGNGILGAGVTVQSGGKLAPVGTLTVSNKLALTAANLRFDLSSSPASGNDQIALHGGALALTNTQNFFFTLSDGFLGPGAYALVDGATNTVSSALGFTHNLPAGSRQTFVFATPPGQVLLNVTGSVASLVWRGTNGGVWDTVTTNWLNGAAADKFWNLDAVMFDDTSANGAVTLAGSIQPRSVVVSNASRAYTFSGGSLDGTTKLTKLGTGTLTLAATNIFSGGTLLSGGTLALGSVAANTWGLGTSSVTLNGGTLQMYGYGMSSTPDYGDFANELVVNTSGTLRVPPRATIASRLTGGGTLNVVDDYVRADFTGDWSAFTGQINVGPRSVSSEFRIVNSFGYGSAAMYLSNSVTAYPTAGGATVVIGELAGSSGATLGPGNGNGTDTTWLVGGRNTPATFAGQIKDAGVTSVIKTGTGTWTLTGSNTFSGGIVVSNGAVLVNNATGSGTGSGAVEVLLDATLGGTGFIAGPVTIQTDATLAPGAPIGRLTFSSNLTLATDSRTFIEVNKALGTNDTVVCSGAVSFDGELVVTNLAGTLAAGDAFQVFSAASLAGDFASITGSPGPGLAWNFNPTNGVLSVVGVVLPPASRFATTISFPGYNRAATLTNIPLLVVLNTNIHGFGYTQFYAPNAGDLRFTMADGSANLNYEIEAWNPGGDSRVWVRVPLLSSNTAIRATWGNTVATNPPASTTNGATWSEGYVGVWHLNDTGAADSTVGGHDAAFNDATVTNGIVTSAAAYNGSSQMTQVPWHGDFNLAAHFEVQGWFRLAAADKPASGSFRTLTSREIAADFNNRNWWLALRSDGRLWWKSSPGIDTTNSTDLANGAWHHFAAVHDGSAAWLYVDGVQAVVDATPGVVSTPTTDVFFGSEDGTPRYHKGPLDEMRVSNVPRSSNWVWAVYQNIVSNSTFTSFSAVAGVVTNPPPPTFDSFALVAGQPTFTIGGAVGYTYAVEGSANLVSWTNLLVTNPLVLPFDWTDVGASNLPMRFYRAVILP